MSTHLIHSEKQIFYCFGCTEGGNVISFLMKHGGISFPDAARSLARRYGVDIPTQMLSPEQINKNALGLKSQRSD